MYYYTKVLLSRNYFHWSFIEKEQYYIRSAWHFADADVPPVQASGGQEQNYIRSPSHLHLCIRLSTFEDADITPSRAICWSRALLHQVSLTFTFMHQVSLTFENADVHSAECNWEGSRHEIWSLEHWGIYVDWCVLLLLLLNVVLVVHLWFWINNYSWTRTTTTLHINNSTNQNKNIAQVMYIDLFVVVVVVYYVILFLFICNCGCTVTDNNNIITQ